tara:strand:- start:8316 stop:8687 length:372 start_codon:yes stop_codon:yes gene_type:complete
MWIFTKNAALSVVEYDPTNGYADDGLAPKDDSMLFVRARREHHLIEFGFPEELVISTPDHDYPFRVIALREKVAELMAGAVIDIDYENYKNEAQKSMPYGMLSEIWSTVRDYLDKRVRRLEEF